MEGIRQTNIPCLSPVCEIMVIHPSLQRHMLPYSNGHVLRRSYIDHWGFARISVRNPYCDWKFVDGAAK